MTKRHLPLIGILTSVFLFVLSAAQYPGGTSNSANSVGYDWAHNFISTLFAASALNGAENPARRIAIPAWLIFCVSIGALFEMISRKGSSKFHKKAIEIGGIGSAIYAFLVITPMHDVLVSIALLFFLTAVLATVHLLYIERHMRLFCAGMICLALLLISAAMYYGNVFFGMLPVAQKLTFASCVGWLLALNYIEFQTQPVGNAVPNATLQPSSRARR